MRNKFYSFTDISETCSYLETVLNPDAHGVQKAIQSGYLTKHHEGSLSKSNVPIQETEDCSDIGEKQVLT